MLSKPINWSGDLQAQIIKVQGENQNQQHSGTLSSKFAGYHTLALSVQGLILDPITAL